MALYSDINFIKPKLGPLVFDVNSVFESIYTILGTKKGERVFRPNFGMNLSEYLFEPCDDLTAASIFAELDNTISIDPRVNFNSSTSSVIPIPEERAFLVTITFSVLGFGNIEKSLNLILRQENT